MIQSEMSEIPLSMRKSLTRRTLAGSSLSRVYSNPQFTPLNQVPYIRPSTVYPETTIRAAPKDPTKKAPWMSTEIGSITYIKVIMLHNM